MFHALPAKDYIKLDPQLYSANAAMRAIDRKRSGLFHVSYIVLIILWYIARVSLYH